MNIDRMKEISGETGLSLNDVSEIQLDDEPQSGKPTTRRMERKRFFQNVGKAAKRVAIFGAIYATIGIGAISYSAYREEHKYDHLPSGWNIIEESPTCTTRVYIPEGRR